MQQDLDLRGKKILVTGGTGFIGSRLVERLIKEHDARVRVFVSRYTNLSRVARFEIEWVKGELTEQTDIQRAVEGCDVIFHCAHGSRGGRFDRELTDVTGTEKLLKSCVGKRIQRFVYLSSSMVYGLPGTTIIDESFPKQSIGFPYADNKIRAERLVRDYHKSHGVPATILQPTAVYGPFSPVWVKGILKNLTNNRVILVNGGTGVANNVYIDDLIDVMLLAAVKKESVGEEFLISGNDRITWREYYRRFEDMLGVSGTVAMSDQEAIELYKAKIPGKEFIIPAIIRHLRNDRDLMARIWNSKEITTLRRLPVEPVIDKVREKLKKGQFNGRKRRIRNDQDEHLLREKPILAIEPVLVKFLAAKSAASSLKAEQVLGYNAKVNFDFGMEIVEKWARWANLICSDS